MKFDKEIDNKDNKAENENEKVDFEKLKFNEVTLDKLQWKPVTNGDYIIGKYLRDEDGVGAGEGLLFHIIEDENGDEVSILGTKVLSSKIEKIEPGSYIKIEYLGEKLNKTNRKYKNFKLYLAE